MMSPLNHELLNQVLVLTGRKNFWASEECKVFPNRIYSKYLMRGSGRWGSSRNPINNISLLFEGY